MGIDNFAIKMKNYKSKHLFTEDYEVTRKFIYWIIKKLKNEYLIYKYKGGLRIFESR